MASASTGDYSICVKSESRNTGNTYKQVSTGSGVGATGAQLFQGDILTAIETIINNRYDQNYRVEQVLQDTGSGDPLYLFTIPDGVDQSGLAGSDPSIDLLIRYLQKDNTLTEATTTTENTALLADTTFTRLVTFIAEEAFSLIRCASETIAKSETTSDLCPPDGSGRLKKCVQTCVFSLEVTVQ